MKAVFLHDLKRSIITVSVYDRPSQTPSSPRTAALDERMAKPAGTHGTPQSAWYVLATATPTDGVSFTIA